jgi:hypothetical protein
MAATDTHTTLQKLLDIVFAMLSIPSVYIECECYELLCQVVYLLYTRIY